MADMMLDMEVDKVVHMDGGLRMMDGKWLSACGSCDLEDKFMGPEGPPSRRIQIRKYNCCVVYRDGITNGVQPGGVRSVVMMPNFINHLHLAMATSTFICYCICILQQRQFFAPSVKNVLNVSSSLECMVLQNIFPISIDMNCCMAVFV